MKDKFLIAASVLMAAPASAPAAPAPRPEAFEALLRCRTIADSAERLACFDAATASLQSATEQREVVVIDRKQIRESKRTLFGLPIPSLPFFDGDKEEDEIKQIEGVVASARKDGNGRWLIALKEGGVWRQIDSNMLGSSPKPGMKVEIERGAVGSFKMRVNGQPGIKVRRES